MLRYRWQNYQIKEGAREGAEFVLVTSDVIRFLADKYGSDIGQPLVNCKRIGV